MDLLIIAGLLLLGVLLFLVELFFIPGISVAGIAALAGSVLVGDVALAALLGVFAFSSFWSIKELFEQEERVRKGWFPRNPKRTKQKTERHEP